MRRKLMAMAAAAALGCLFAGGCEKKTVTTTETEKTTDSGAPTPGTTPMMAETPVPPATTPTP